jgi:hypothetical protein
MGIRDQPTAAWSPSQNGYAKRLIGSIRRDCLDYVVVFGEWHLRHLLESYQRYYSEARTHLSLSKDGRPNWKLKKVRCAMSGSQLIVPGALATRVAQIMRFATGKSGQY